MATGNLTLRFAVPRLVLSGDYQGITPSDTSNGAGGRDERGGGHLEFTPAVVAPVSPIGVLVDKAMAYPTPVLVKGRPT